MTKTRDKVERGASSTDDATRLIDELNQRNKELRASEARFRAAFESASIGRALTLPDGRLARVNRALCEMLGYAAEELQDKSFEAITHPDDLEASRECLRCLLAGEQETCRFEKRYRHRNGVVVWTDVNTTLLRDEHGEPQNFITDIVDITERKRAEEALQKNVERLRLIIKGSNDAPWDWDLTSNELFYSPQWWEQIGYSQDELPADSQLWQRLMHPEDSERVNSFFQKALGDGTKSYEVEFRLAHKKGHWVPILSRGFISRDAQGVPVRVSGTNMDLSERKRAERDALILKTAVHQAPVGIALADADINIYYCNPNGLGMRGGSTDVLVEIPRDAFENWQVLRLDGKPYAVEDLPLVRAIGRGEVIREEFIVQHEDGVRHICDAVACPVFERKKIIGGLVIFLDITERKRAELDLRRSEDRARSYVEHAPYGVFIADAEGRYVETNPAAARITGYSAEELCEMSIPELLADEGKDLGAAHFAEVREKGTASGVVPFLRKDGERRYGSVEAVRLSDDRFIAFVDDVTEHRQIEEQLRQSERDLVLAQRIAGIGSWKYEVASGRVKWSRQLFKLYGCDPDTTEVDLDLAIGRIHPNDKARMTAIFEKAVKLGDAYRTDYRVALPSGEVRVLETIGEVIKDASGNVLEVSGTARDVTEARSLDAQLAQADRLASMGTLAAGVAHEINNPLAYTLYNLETVVEDLPNVFFEYRKMAASLGSAAHADDNNQTIASSSSQLDELLVCAREALDGAQRIRSISRTLGTVARVDDTEEGPIDIRHAAEHARNMARNETKYRAQLLLDLAPTPPVLGSEGKLAQVFLNLLLNAAHAIDEGNVDSNSIRIRTYPDGDNVVAEVSDTGKGIPEDNLRQLFNPFFSTKPIGQGSGLGLSISKKIITDMGGEISCESQEGQGATFRIRLPALRDDERRPQERSTSAAPSISSPKGRVLVVDDEAGIRASITHMLGRDNHEVLTAASGAEGRKLLEQDQRFDLIILDLMMPEVSGMALHRWLAETHPELADRVIFVTGGVFTPGAQSYLSKVDNMRLEKPLDTATFRKLVGNWVAGRVSGSKPE